MTSLSDKAEAADAPDVILASDSRGVYRLKTEELSGPNEVTPEGDFPEYGDFVHVDTTTGGANATWNEEAYVEVPGSLAKALVENEIGTGDTFRIQTVSKVDGTWSFGVDPDPDMVPDAGEPDSR